MSKHIFRSQNKKLLKTTIVALSILMRFEQHQGLMSRAYGACYPRLSLRNHITQSALSRTTVFLKCFISKLNYSY